jgi:hypothetical protein
MMCSLVTNQSGETRYIGECPLGADYYSVSLLTLPRRIIVWVLNPVSQGHTMGQLQDRRRLIPANDF